MNVQVLLDDNTLWKIHKIVTPIPAAETDVLSLLEQINMDSSMWETAIDLVNVLFSIVRKENLNQFTFR